MVDPPGHRLDVRNTNRGWNELEGMGEWAGSGAGCPYTFGTRDVRTLMSGRCECGRPMRSGSKERPREGCR